MKTILFPTDFSAHSEQAFKYAKAIANELNAKLLVLHAYHIPASVLNGTPSALVDVLKEEQIEKAKKRFQELMEKSKEEGKDYRHLDIRYELELGFAVNEIVSYADAFDVDLIVMGTKGAKNKSEHLLGSITSHVIKEAKCPVLAIPKDAVYKKLNNIALAVDMQDEDIPAFKQLVLFAKIFGANVHVVHISKEVKGKEGGDYEVAMSREVDITFSERFSNSLEEGLKDFIKEKNINLLGMIAQQRNFWKRFLHKSATRNMVLHTDIPLITFHA